ncbi:uncharacterized protein B0H18DRAFT_894592 [Fomitopsis serialis]|uniref:uncharacterized protein n=1 Tax=Fomitopsis serialis TaxID=139415 RepID=UPI00200760CF|nr:uncharacterized protein B0H18DRAFT_894592 [Neoantrodia serialis]KAH9910739.1 hypothetical protein B0H18DRAFT_894592 [Neoantrodia serialis]
MTATQANGLRRWEPNEREWEIATQLRDVLVVFYHATQFFSREGEEAPDLTDVIPSMDYIDHRLATDAINTSLDPAIRVAIGMAKRTINRYYDKSDESAAYRIAMVLDPRYKFKYFQDNDWPDEWISEAHSLLRQTYDDEWAGRVPVLVQHESAEQPKVR